MINTKKQFFQQIARILTFKMKVPLILLGNIVEISLFVCQIQYQLSKLTNTHTQKHTLPGNNWPDNIFIVF